MAQALMKAGFGEHADELAHEEVIVVPGSSADQIPVAHAAFIHEDPATELDVQSAFGHGCDAPAPDGVRRADDLDAMTDARHRLVVFEEAARERDQAWIVAQVFGSAAACQK